MDYKRKCKFTRVIESEISILERHIDYFKSCKRKSTLGIIKLS